MPTNSSAAWRISTRDSTMRGSYRVPAPLSSHTATVCAPTIRAVAVGDGNGGTIRGMAGDDWDEIDLDKERPKPPPIPGSTPKRGGRALRLGWLTALLFAAGGAAVAALAMEAHVDHANELARSRDEAAELRRT